MQYSQKRVYDPVIQSASGLASIQADENDRPRMMRLIVPDKVTALTSAQAIAAALVQRYRTGKGAHVELAMLDATLSFAWGEGMARYGTSRSSTSHSTGVEGAATLHLLLLVGALVFVDLAPEEPD